jgi:hypothetical protein
MTAKRKKYQKVLRHLHFNPQRQIRSRGCSVPRSS